MPPFDGMIGGAYLYSAHPERCIEWCRAGLECDPDSVHIRACLVFGLVHAGSGEEAMAVADGLIEAAEATANPFMLSFALFAFPDAFREADPARSLDAARRGLLIAQESGNRLNETQLAITLLVLALQAKMKPGKATNPNPNPSPVRALSDATVRQIYIVLRSGLDGAVCDGMLARNPAAAVKRPGVARKEARHIEAVDVTKLLLCADGLRYRNALVLVGGTGMPRGEALALHWSDIDLEARVVAVRGTLGRVGGELIITEPKTDRSRRSVPLSAPLVAMLRAHRADQDAERVAAGDQWQDHGLVFATELGTPVDPRNVLRTVQIAAQKAGMADIGVHTLRHSAAVAWLEGQVHIKAVADLLGHSSIAVTGDTYGHTSDTTARSAVDALADQLGILDI